jgi:hypothetical protein
MKYTNLRKTIAVQFNNQKIITYQTPNMKDLFFMFLQMLDLLPCLRSLHVVIKTPTYLEKTDRNLCGSASSDTSLQRMPPLGSYNFSPGEGHQVVKCESNPSYIVNS